MYNTDLPTRAELPSSRQLIKSTVLAVVAAAVLLVTVVMPAEYGIDPLGAGRLLGLKQMGEIKTSLAQEANEELQSAPVPTAATDGPADPAPQPVAQTAPEVNVKPAALAGRASDQMTIALKPGQGAEVKMDMVKNAEVRFEWTAQGGTVNFDNHGDPKVRIPGFYHGYGKGWQVQQDAGAIKAAFDGKHGFFWRNRSPGTVTILLKTNGDYSAIKRVL